MKSKILIDMDHNNHPIIVIELRSTEDLRDKMVNSFIKKLNATGHISCYNTSSGQDSHGEYFNYVIEPYDIIEKAGPIDIEKGSDCCCKSPSENCSCRDKTVKGLTKEQEELHNKFYPKWEKIYNRFVEDASDLMDEVNGHDLMEISVPKIYFKD